MEIRQETTRYDHTERRRSERRGRERGIRVYIPAAELRRAGIDPHGPAPEYKLWGNADRGSCVFVKLYLPET
jgi:hypothetical protein